MEDKKRLVELLRASPYSNATLGEIYYKSAIVAIADYLLENGVIVLPVKVGQTVLTA